MNEASDPSRSERPSPASATHAYSLFPQFAEWANVVFDSQVFDAAEDRLARRRASSGEDALARAVQQATRAAAVDTGAIEGLYSTDRGFTRTVATQAAAWEMAAESRGPHVLPAIDDALHAYEYVLDAATEARPITETWIRELHQIICRSQEEFIVHTAVGPQAQPLPKGVYKSMPNSPTSLSSGLVHHYAPVLDTPHEMSRLIQELNSVDFLEAHPVLQAAYAHYAYVCVHPFADGNGRVARALASVYLYRRPGVPLVVFADQRDQYLDALEAADGGSYELFVNFMEARSVDTIGIVCASIQSDGPSAASSLAAINEALQRTVGAELGSVSTRLTSLLSQEFRKQVDRLGSSPVSWSYPSFGTASPPAGHVLGSEGSKMAIFAQVPAPANVSLLTTFGTFIPTDPIPVAEFVIVGVRGSDPLQVSLREIEPAITEVLRIKIEAWVEGQLTEMLAQVAAKTRKSLGG